MGDMTSNLQRILHSLYKRIRNSITTIKKLEGAPSWITNKSLQEEHDNKWIGAYREVEENGLQKKDNVITSHVIYKVKTSEDGDNSMKVRIFPHGNKDDLRNGIRKDSSTGQYDVIRLLLSLATFMSMTLAVVDISGAYMESGPITREIYVRPPREWQNTKRGSVWKLLKLHYGVVEAGRQ